MKQQRIFLPVTKIQRFSTHDGPGIRTTVFLKGCPLHCLWCHNPETQSRKADFFYTDAQCIRCSACKEICPRNLHRFTGDTHTVSRDACARCMKCVRACPSGALESCQSDLSAEEILSHILRDNSFYGKTGGVTLSGGEPMLHGKKSLALLKMCKEAKVNTAVETCGVFDPALIAPLCEVTDLFLWDIKDTCDERHRLYTGAGVEQIHQNLLCADRLGAKTLLRCIMVKGVNMEEGHYNGILTLYSQLQHCLGAELIPCHGLGESKYRQLGMENRFDEAWIPTEQDMRAARRALSGRIPLV